ncbi:hypothetical protein EEJ42_38090 [Streptomyces botrytidirepellens]|uniref:Uncharacterized protein n=2 Tax=Streptomyces botrytidirepellens TaxID=2486417 RepID=A0A3M8TRV1_9ACTN|nr:hypothetical protein EEJ42_38090 [Streptomyces botrytidirepellens]
MEQEGLRVDLVVVACSRPVNARIRESLDKLCTDRELPPAHIYAQDWFVRQLVRDAAWRRSLLGIEGRLGALVDEPLEAPLAACPPPLVGRAVELEALSAAVEAGHDVVLVGVPGVGKTRLAGQLHDRVVYVEPASLAHLHDDLLLTPPRAVIVKDAHALPDVVRALRHARRQTGLSFSVVATTWPDRLEEVLEQLPGARAVSVGLLEREDMNALVESTGITGYRSRAVILNQSNGRPGWAVPLCELLAGGQDKDVFSGKAQVARVERYLRKVTTSHTALDALACVAALGGASPEALHTLASLTGMAPAELSGVMEGLTHNGLVESVQGAWRLQPALCAPLVARWFFTSPGRRPWDTLVDAFPGRELDLASAVMSAAGVSSSPRARAQAEGWIQSLPAPTCWGTDVFAVVAQYARLDQAAAEFAVNRALAVLAAPREPEELYGLSVAPVGHAATQLLIQCARQFLLPEAVAGLLSLAVGDERRRHSTADHPLRVLSDLAGMIDPDFGTSLEIRTRLLQAVLRWAKRHHGSVDQWRVAAEALAGIFSVEVSGNWPDPGAPHTVTFAHGVETAANLSRLLGLWEQVVPLLTAQATTADEIPCPPPALVCLLDMALGWVRLGQGITARGETPSAEQMRCGAEGGSRILAVLHPLLQRNPGTALRAHLALGPLQHRAQAAGQPLPAFDVDPDLQAFCERRSADFSDDFKTAIEQMRTQVEALAEKLIALGPRAGVTRFGELAEQAAAAGYSTGHLAALRMGKLMTDPAAWYQAATASDVVLLLGPALTQWLTTAPGTVPPSVLRPALEDASTRPAVLGAVLARSVVDATGELVISSMRAEDAAVLETLFCHEADEVMHRLLNHPVPVIAASAAISFAVGTPHGPALPQEWQDLWSRAVEHLRIDDLPSHGQWQAGCVLAHLTEHDPDTFEAWFHQRLHEMSDRGWYTSPLPHDGDPYLARLPRPHRLRLAIRCIGLPCIGHSALIHLVGSDTELAEQLLDEHAVSPDKMVDALLGQRNAAVEQLGPLLLERGVGAQKIAASVAWYDSWWGDRSLIHADLLEYFRALADRVPALRAVAAAGRVQQKELLQRAEEQERAERIHGWDDDRARGRRRGHG